VIGRSPVVATSPRIRVLPVRTRSQAAPTMADRNVSAIHTNSTWLNPAIGF
jgi:hypothetical protein